ncbi:hypothetical protein QSV08_07750 [Maribacter sp. BPC-D8]|uniref:hypothetical protein n=1 Tax=Maribacter sp. BPC-D8 TaxID=3053613 RepID=UPI002B49B5FF|nr:hypothetical protein [Maribacter sp. BPC-D8]WRI31138.1 hypothetical protein QSV08_07750 [Maribacter sp. BPC-D8]
MKTITTINRFIMAPFILCLLLGVLEGKLEEDWKMVSAIIAVPLGIFQVISSFTLYSQIKKLNKKVIKQYLFGYHIALVIYVLTFIAIGFQNKGGDIFTQLLLLVTPILLAIGFTIILELLYDPKKKSTGI